jgi:hypothetical protein
MLVFTSRRLPKCSAYARAAISSYHEHETRNEMKYAGKTQSSW